MKSLALFNENPGDFQSVQVQRLESIWLASGNLDPNALKLHQCALPCGRFPDVGTYHFPSCDYAEPDWPHAVAIAWGILHGTTCRTNDRLTLDAKLVHATARAQVASTATADAATSLLTDPLELDGPRKIGNGRHRIAALVDANLQDELVPLITRP